MGVRDKQRSGATVGSLKSFIVELLPRPRAYLRSRSSALCRSLHNYTNHMAQFVFEAILLFALNISITVDLR